MVDFYSYLCELVSISHTRKVESPIINHFLEFYKTCQKSYVLVYFMLNSVNLLRYSLRRWLQVAGFLTN